MQSTQSVQSVALLAAAVLVALALARVSGQAPPSEPYTHHFDPYSYGYESEDNYGNKQWKQERSSHPHEVHGSYGYRDNHGVYREVTYVADQNGFRANIKTNEPGISASDKAPASTKLESHYAPSQAGLAGHSALGHLFAPAGHHQSAPVYSRTHSYHQ